jgi:hypothetical protein
VLLTTRRTKTSIDANSWIKSELPELKDVYFAGQCLTASRSAMLRHMSPLQADFVAEVRCKRFWSVIPSL